jgi:hypothetical protein
MNGIEQCCRNWATRSRIILKDPEPQHASVVNEDMLFCIPLQCWAIYITILKGQCHEIFDPRFFHQTITPRALIHGLKPFCIWLRFRRENRDNRLQTSDPAVSMRPRKLIPRSNWDRRNFITKIFNFIYVFSVVHCQSRITFHVGSRGLNETAEILWHRGNPYKNEYWFSFPLKGNHCKNQYICKHCIPIVTRKRQY